jgi:DedD protein
MASGGRKGAGERVLGSRHVIGLFMLMLVFSCIFFTLGYVMGRNQYSGQVGASTMQHNPLEPVLPEKSDPGSKHTAKKLPVPDATAPSSGWDQYSSDKEKETDEHLKPAMPPVAAAPKPAPSSAVNNRTSVPDNDSPRAAQQISGGYTLQVTAVRRESEALDLARRLQKKKFPAFVMAPLGNKYYRVQVGPYADKKSAEAARKGLENAGFRAIVKRG